MELYNTGPHEVDLRWVGLADTSGSSWTGVGSLAPGAFLVLAADDEQLPFKLDGDGDALVLHWRGEPSHEVAWEELPADVAWARRPATDEVAGDFDASGLATPGGPNRFLPPDPTLALFATSSRAEITLTAPARRSLQESPRQEVLAELVWNGVEHGPVGVRLVGGPRRFRPLYRKPHLRVRVDAVRPRGQVLGLDGLVLDAAHDDATGLVRALASEAYRQAGVPAPRAQWVELSVDDALAPYVLVEPRDRRWLRRHQLDGATVFEVHGPDPQAEGATQHKAGPERAVPSMEGWPEGLDEQAWAQLRAVGERIGHRGYPEHWLLVVHDEGLPVLPGRAAQQLPAGH